MDQAFVKAFARRNRRSNRGSGTRLPASEPVASPSSPPVASSTPVNSVEETVRLVREPGSLQVDQSVASTAQVWVDPIEDSIARADEGVSALPRPHVEANQPPQPQIEKASPSEAPTPEAPTPADGIEAFAHMHTAYATPLAETPVAAPQQTTFEMPAQVPFESTLAPSQIPDADVAPVVPNGTVDEKTELRIDAPSPIAPMAHIPFQAVWEVDVFDVPNVVADLFFEGVLFQQIAERMSEAVSSGLNTVLVTSMCTGEGRSSVAIGMAMAAAAAGIRVALVDADTQDPTLADDLRLDLRFGWVDAIRGGLPIKEVAVLAVEDGVTLVPLMPPQGKSSVADSELIEVMDLLKYKFELVIIDGPAGTSPCLKSCASSVDSAIIVRDVTRTDPSAINAFTRSLRDSGVQGVGVVENFV